MTRYCICRSRDSSGFMVFCERCEEWFHARCLKKSKKELESVDKFYCEECTKIMADVSAGIKTEVDLDSESKSRNDIKPKIDLKSKLNPNSENRVTKQKQFKKKKIQSTAARRKAANHKPRCGNVDCNLERRNESQYCSDKCGYEMNKKRYVSFFVPKMKDLRSNQALAYIRRQTELGELEKEKKNCEERISFLKEEKKQLEENIKIIKEEALKQYKTTVAVKKEVDEESDSDEEEAITGDISKAFCITCGMMVPSGQTFRHWTLCHKKIDSEDFLTANAPASYRTDDDPDPKLFCQHLDKKAKRYCMKFESYCPQHRNWLIDKDEVCGCPLNYEQKLILDGNYCTELKQECSKHYHWDKFRLTLLNVDRIQAFHKLSEIDERMRLLLSQLLDSYGGCIGIMLHDTIEYNK